MADFPGTLLTVAPGAMDLPMLLRVAVDAEQIGVTRLELPPEIEDPGRVVAALRDQTRLIITAMADSSTARFVDLVGHFGIEDQFGSIPVEYRRPGAIDTCLVELHSGVLTDLPATAGSIALGIGHHRPLPVSLAGNGDGAILASLAALAAGGHVCVGTRTSGGEPRQNLALAAKAGGIARLAGRPALNRAAAIALLGLG